MHDLHVIGPREHALHGDAVRAARGRYSGARVKDQRLRACRPPERLDGRLGENDRRVAQLPDVYLQRFGAARVGGHVQNEKDAPGIKISNEARGRSGYARGGGK